jgi:hypothetical protein
VRKAQALAGLERCTSAAIAAIRRACAEPPLPPERGWETFALEQAVRMTRMAAYYAFKLRPDLRPPDSYDLAVAAFRERR